jgi:hypothetical protein
MHKRTRHGLLLPRLPYILHGYGLQFKLLDCGDHPPQHTPADETNGYEEVGLVEFDLHDSANHYTFSCILLFHWRNNVDIHKRPTVIGFDI